MERQDKQSLEENRKIFLDCLVDVSEEDKWNKEDLTEEIQLVILAGNTIALTGGYVKMRNPEAWKGPLKFDPARFLPEEVSRRHPWSYLPFGCSSKKLHRHAMVTILKSYKTARTTYGPIDDVKLKFEVSRESLNDQKIQ